MVFLKEKLESFEKFKIFKGEVENESGMKIKCLRSYNGGDFTSNEFNKFSEIYGLKDNFQLQRLLGRMVLLKGRIESSKKLPEQ